MPILLYVSMWVSEGVWVPHACRCQKRMSDPLEVELETVGAAMLVLELNSGSPEGQWEFLAAEPNL